MEKQPSRMIRLLRETGALDRLFPEIERLFIAGVGTAMLAAIDRAATADGAIEVRFATMMQPIDSDAISALCARLAVPRAARDLALVVAKEGPTLLAATAATMPPADVLVEAMERADAFRRPDRFRQAIAAVGWTIEDLAARNRLSTAIDQALGATLSIDEVAHAARTVGYELMCARAPRVPVRVVGVR